MLARTRLLVDFVGVTAEVTPLTYAMDSVVTETVAQMVSAELWVNSVAEERLVLVVILGSVMEAKVVVAVAVVTDEAVVEIAVAAVFEAAREETGAEHVVVPVETVAVPTMHTWLHLVAAEFERTGADFVVAALGRTGADLAAAGIVGSVVGSVEEKTVAGFVAVGTGTDFVVVTQKTQADFAEIVAVAAFVAVTPVIVETVVQSFEHSWESGQSSWEGNSVQADMHQMFLEKHPHSMCNQIDSLEVMIVSPGTSIILFYLVLEAQSFLFEQKRANFRF